MAIEICVLGPIEARVDNAAAALGPRERAVLADLAISAGRTVTLDRLADDLGGSVPLDVEAVRVYVSRLRKALRQAGADEIVETRPGGYVLAVQPACVDAVRFDETVRAASGALEAGDPAEGSKLLREALAMWRGPALAEVADMPFARGEATRLEEARLGAFEDRVEADLACGRAGELIGELEAACAAHPLRERLWAHRLLALYRAGRQADALRAYQDLRMHLAEELGIEPSPELRDLEAGILEQRADLTAPAARTPPARGSDVVLPSGVVTFLLTDVVASTELWDRDATAMADALARHDEVIGSAISRHGGTVLKSRGEGDSTFSIFARATDAAAAAVSVQRAIDATDWTSDCVIEVRVACHTGEALERDGDYYGPAVNRAARLRDLAGKGQILCSSSTAELVFDRLPAGTSLVDLGRRELRGIAREQQVYDLHWRRSAAEPGEVASEPAEPLRLPPPLAGLTDMPFVGRAKALNELRRAWQDGLEGSAAAVLVGGEPGIGKTRLISEFARDVHAAGATVLFGTCEEDLEVPYQPFAEALGAYVAACPIDLLKGHVRMHGGDLARLVPDLEARVPDVPPPLQAEPESERYRLFEAVTSLLAAAAERAPVLLVLDDLQWATKPTLLLLRHLVRDVRPCALLVVGMYRETERSEALRQALAALRREPGVERLVVTGLEENDVASYLRALADDELDDAGRAFAEWLHEQTAGSPFFITEVLRHLIETRAVVPRGGRWMATLDAFEVPASIREVVARRLLALSERGRRVLTEAAVIGQTFSVALLGATDTSAARDEILDAIDEAEAAGMVREVPRAVGVYAFTHALVRQALYDQLLSIRRTRIHRRVAEALEARAAGSRTHLGEIARHYIAAAADGVADKAVSYAALAAEAAIDGVAYEEAVRLYQQAIEIADWAGLADTTTTCDLMLGLADARWKAGDLVPARETYGEAAAIARRLGDPERLARAALRNESDLGGYAHSLSADDGMVALLEEALVGIGEGDTELRARLLARLANELYWTSSAEVRRERLADEAVGMAERLADDRLLLFTLQCRAWATERGSARLEDRLAAATRVLELAEALQEPEIAYQAQFLRVSALVDAGNFAAADAEAAIGQELADRLRVPAYLPWVAAYRAFRAFVGGALEDAERLNAEAMDEALRRRTDPDLVFAMLGGQAMFIRYLRDISDVVPMLSSVAEMNPQLMPLHLALAVALITDDQFEDARHVYERVAGHDFADFPHDATWLNNSAMAATVCAEIGDNRRAALLYDSLVPFADRWASAALVTWGPVSLQLGDLATALGRWEAAERHFADARSRTEAVPAPLFHASATYRYARMLVRRRNDGDTQKAEQLLIECLRTSADYGLTTLDRWARQLSEEIHA